MRLIPLSSILIPSDRQRQEFDPGRMVELSNSIQSIGLLHPIVVRQSIEGPVLVAGERRIRAIKDIWALGGYFIWETFPLSEDTTIDSVEGKGVIPVVELGELTELQWVEAEYSENKERDNLSWQEEAAATTRLSRLRNLQADLSREPPPTVAALAEELHGRSDGSYQDNTRKQLIVAKHFNRPEVAGAKTLDEAFKFLKREEEVERRTVLAKRVGATFTSAVHQLHNTDSCLWLPEQEANQFDVILTDPPYGMGADNFGDAGGGNHPHLYDDSSDNLLSILNAIMDHLYRVAKPQAHLYLFCDIDWFHDIRGRAERAGWKVHRTPIVWHKPNGFLWPWPEQGPVRTHELILYAVKGDRKVTQRSADVISCPTEPGTTGAQKPVELFKELLKRSVQPGDRVLDPFAGKGSVFPAADSLKCQAVGVEKDPAEYTKAMERLTKLKGTS